MVVWWLTVLSFAVRFSDGSVERSACTAASNFKGSTKDWALVGHVIDAFEVRDELQCAHKCLSRDYCRSYNYGYLPEDGGHLCELNQRTAREFPASFQASHGVRYYEPAATPGMVKCEMNCQNGGRCVDAHVASCRPLDKFKCDCPVDFKGRHCELVAGRSCEELKKLGASVTGEYTINPRGLGRPVKVYCDQTTDGGGWTVIQRRRQPMTTNFTRGWEEYRKGFGDVSGDHWLGNDVIYSMTNATPAELLVELLRNRSQRGFARYGRFQVSGIEENFRLVIANYSGDIGDSITDDDNTKTQVNMQFTTFDRDNDGNPRNGTCGGGGGWWLNSCGYANLNRPRGIKWDSWLPKSIKIVSSEMKIR